MDHLTNEEIIYIFKKTSIKIENEELWNNFKIVFINNL